MLNPKVYIVTYGFYNELGCVYGNGVTVSLIPMEQLELFSVPCAN
jgi:hypothetical protein